MFLGIITCFKWSLTLGELSCKEEWVETQGERDGWWVKKGAGRSCLLNHITVKGIALTLSPLRALSIHTNLLIDRRSSQTAPSPHCQAPQGSPSVSLWPHRQPLGTPATTYYSGSWLTRICHVDLKTTCSSCEYIMQRGEQTVLCFLLPRCAALSVAEQIQEKQLQMEEFNAGPHCTELKVCIWLTVTYTEIKLHRQAEKFLFLHEISIKHW